MSTYVKAEVEIMPTTHVSGTFVSKTDEIPCIHDLAVNIGIDFGLTTGSTPVGTQFLIQKNFVTSSDGAWRNLTQIVTGTVQPTLMDTDADVAAGQTLVACSNSVWALNDVGFFRDFTTIASSQWGTVVNRATAGGSESVTLLDPTTNVITSNRYFNKAEQYVIPIDLQGVNSYRIVCNNNYAATPVNIAWRAKATYTRGTA